MIEIIDLICFFTQHYLGKQTAMSTIQEVREAEKKVREALEALKEAGPQYPDELNLELQQATDEYARTIRELAM